MTIAEGTQFGPYRLIEKIGSGGMGEVYRALDTRIEREVALKLVSETYLITGVGSGSPSPVTPPHGNPNSHVSHERFLREARSSATLNHPNVCSIHDTGEHDGRPYLVMELLRGETLKHCLAKAGGKGLAPDEVISFSQQAASALAAAHAKGILHRDIKPANLFVVDAGRGKRLIKILDFGLAKKQPGVAVAESRTYGLPGSGDETVGGGTATMELTSPGSAVGTVAYMSPEQAKGDPLDARTDLFSLGTVIYEMATGQAPFGGRSTAEVFAALLMKEPPPVNSLNPAMPKALDPVIVKLLAKDRDQRYRSAEELLADLEAISGSSSSSNGTASAATAAPIPPASTPPPLPDSDGRRPRNRLIAIGALVLVAGAGGAFMFRDHLGTKPVPESSTSVAPGGVPAAKPATSKDSIIVPDFINKTGDAVFDT